MSASVLDDELGILLDPAQLNLLVELGGGPAANEGRDRAMEDLEACGALTIVDGAPRLDEAFAVVAEVLARPTAVLDIHLMTAGERRRVTIMCTVEGSLRVVRVGEGIIVTPVLTSELLFQVGSELGMELDPVDPKALSTEIEVQRSELASVLDGGSVVSGPLEGKLGEDLRAAISIANVSNGSDSLDWVLDAAGVLWLLVPGQTPEAVTLKRLSEVDLLQMMGLLIVRSDAAIELLVPCTARYMDEAQT